MDVDSFIAANASAPQLDPATTYGVSQSAGNVGSAVDNAQATAGFAHFTALANTLKGMSPGDQQRAWGTYTPQDQQALSAAGFTPAKPHHSLWDDITSGNIPRALGQVASDAGVGTKAFGALGQLASQPLHAEQHLERAGRMVSANVENLGADSSKASVGGLQQVHDLGRFLTSFVPGTQDYGSGILPGQLSPHQWAKALDETKNGEKTYDPAMLRDVRSSVDQPTFDLAKTIADFGAGKQQQKDAWIKAQPNAADIVQRLQDDTGLQQAIATLERSKMSIGRALVGEGMQADHPAIASKISGGVDAAFDWYADPLNKAIGLVSDANKARFVVSSADDVLRLANEDPALGKVYQPVVQALNDFGEGLTPDAKGVRPVSALLSKYPGQSQAINLMVNDGVSSKADVVKWLADKAGTRALMSGEAGGLGRAGQEMPHMTAFGAAAFSVKASLEKAIDFGEEQPVIGGAARSIKRITTLIPVADKGGGFDAQGPNALNVVGDVASTILGRSAKNDLVDAFAAADLGGKRRIYLGLVKQIGEMSGLKDVPALAPKWEALVNSIGDNIRTGMFSTATDASGARVDMLPLNGDQVGSGILLNQMQSHWGIPSYIDLVAAKNRATLGDKFFSAVNQDGISSLMQSTWKPMMTLRLGMAPRIAGEELFGAILRDGASGLLKARLATSAVAGEMNPADHLLPTLPWHPIEHIQQWFPQKIIDATDKPGELWTQYIGNKAVNAFRNVEGKLAGADYYQAAKELWDTGWGEASFADEISAVNRRGAGLMNDAFSTADAARRGEKLGKVQMVATGDFKGYQSSDEMFRQVYQRNLTEAARDPLARAALAEHGNGVDAQVANVEAALKRQPESVLSKATRYNTLRTGDTVGVQGITRDDALHDWAQVVTAHVNSLVTTPTGEIVGDLPGVEKNLVQHLYDHQTAPTMDMLNLLPDHQLPLSVKGPEMIPMAGQSAKDAYIQKGFENFVGRPMDWMARQPMFLHNYVLAKREIAGFNALGEISAEDMTRAAVDRAVAKTIPFIHDPSTRSELSVNVRNLIPFEYAQEQFYKRWARTLKYAPEAFREAQLIHMGVQHAGITHTDANGNEFFNYPLVGQFQRDVLLPAIKQVTGYDATVPVTMGFSGFTQYMTPGLSSATPSSGPFITIPIKILAQRFPELAPLDTAVEGQQGASTPIWEQLVPPTVARVYHAVAGNPQSDPQMASAMAQAMQYLEATGHGLADDATVAQKQAYIDRVTNWSRITLLTRALVGFAGPAAPTLNVDANLKATGPVAARLSTLINELPLNEATAELVRENPDATPYTVFKSTSPGMAAVPATQAAMDYMNNNPKLIANFPLAAGWFLPQAPGAYDSTTYRQQLADGLRARKSPQQILDGIKYAEAAPVYWATYDAYQLAKAAAGKNSQAVANIERQWTPWQQAYLNAHPTFDSVINSGTAKQDRAHLLSDMKAAIASPDLPDDRQSEAIKSLISTFASFQDSRSALSAAHTTAAGRQITAEENQMAEWGAQWQAYYPEMAPLYDRLVRPEIGGATAQAQALAANAAGG